MKKISIHAPARGATEVQLFSNAVKEFQSTLPRGERHDLIADDWQVEDFNPRSREGSDNYT